MIALSLLVMGCVPDRPAQIVDADVVGVVRATSNPIDAEKTAELEDGTIVEIARAAIEFYGPGVSADRLLLLGEDFNRKWFASLVMVDRPDLDDCYLIDGVSYDEPDAVIVLSGDWGGVGLRLPKRSDFDVPDELIDDNGLYKTSGEFPEAGFCVDTAGMVFGLA